MKDYIGKNLKGNDTRRAWNDIQIICEVCVLGLADCRFIGYHAHNSWAADTLHRKDSRMKQWC